MSPATPPRFLSELDLLVRARYPLIYLVSWEEQRLDALLVELAKSQGRSLFEWSAVKGLKRVGVGRPLSTEDTRDPPAVIAAIGEIQEPSLVVLKDFHPYLESPTLVRAVRELAARLKNAQTTVLFLSPTLVMPPELEKEVTVVDIPLPTFDELFALLRDIVSVVRRAGKAKIEVGREQAEALVKAAMGLTLSEAENAFAKAIASDARLSEADIQLIQDEKRQIIRKSGLLEYFAPDRTLGDVGGLDLLKTWLERRTSAFGEEARAFGLPSPKGLLLLGVQGCGKSLTAKAVAAHWHLPLLRLDVGRLFSSFVGSSEENLRKAIRVAESVAPCVLWVDELEKGLAGAGGSGGNDNGVSQRIFGGLLTWLQEKTAPVFVVATANRIDLLPPELLRKGRFDEIFFIDLPSEKEREDIFRIHLQARKRDPAAFDLPALARRAHPFSGAEIEQALVSSLYEAFSQKRDVDQALLLQAIGETVPLATTMQHEIERLRLWARTRTRKASSLASEPADV